MYSEKRIRELIASIKNDSEIYENDANWLESKIDSFEDQKVVDKMREIAEALEELSDLMQFQLL